MIKEKSKSYYYFISALTAFMVAVIGVYATTIGTNVSVTGTLSSDGAATMSSTLSVTGNSTLTSVDVGGAYSAGGSGATFTTAGKGQFNGDLEINGFATTTATTGHFDTEGGITASSTLAVDGNANFGGGYTAGGGSGATLTTAGKGQFNGDLEINGFATTTATTGNLVTQGTLGVATTSSWAKLSAEMDTSNPSFVVSNQGSTTPALIVGGVNQDGRVGIASTTPSKALGVAGDAMFISAATTTITISSTGGAGSGSCLQMENGNSANTMYRVYVDGAGTGLKVEAGTCQ